MRFASFALTVWVKCEEFCSCFSVPCTGVGFGVGGVSDALEAFGACSGGGGDEGGTAWGGAWLEHGCVLFLYMGVSESEGLCEKLFLCGLCTSLCFAFLLCFALCVWGVGGVLGGLREL